MFRRVIGSILVAALLLQGWVASAAAMPVESAPIEHCAGDAGEGSDPGCCPDDGASGNDCQTHCSLSLAITVEIMSIVPLRGAPPERLLPPGRAGPTYLPPNPPPNA